MIIVQKYGGSSVADNDKLYNVAKKVKKQNSVWKRIYNIVCCYLLLGLVCGSALGFIRAVYRPVSVNIIVTMSGISVMIMIFACGMVVMTSRRVGSPRMSMSRHCQ